MKGRLVWLLRRVRGAWYVLTDKSFGDPASYKYEVYVAPESWRCTRCGGGFGASLVPPPHFRPWRMEHICAPKSPLYAKRSERGKLVYRVDPNQRPAFN